MGSKRVVVVHDASKEVNWAAIKGVLHNFNLKAGDELILLGVVHQFNNSTTTSAFLGTAKLLGQRNKVEQKLVEEELAKRMEEYNKNLEMFVLLKQCEVHKVKFHIEVQAGNSRKVVAVLAIKRLEATWIILDREMKKEKKYFMEKLSCGISKLKSSNSIEEVRGPLKLMENTKVTLTRNTFSYDEMIPGDDDASEELPSSQQISAKAAWDALHIAYANKSQTRIFSLRDRLARLTKDCRPVTGYLHQVRSLCDELATAGAPVSNPELIVKILSGLGSEFRELSVVIRARDSPISYEELYEKLLDYEFFLKHEEDKKPLSTPITAAVAQKTSSTPSRQSNNNYSSNRRPDLKVMSRIRSSCKEQASSIARKPCSDFCENSVKRSSSTDLMDSNSSLKTPRSSSISSHNKATTTENSLSRDSKEREEIFNDQYYYGVISKKSECSFCGNRRSTMIWHKEFSYKELEEATKGFSSENFLSEGGFGSVYKGILKNGLRVAVKKHNDTSLQGDKEFKSEVEVLSKARHPNLVMLLGSCSEGSQRLLVYEYVCNGSLDQFLSGDTRMPLNWDRRIKIALGAARGLEYLHKHNIIHRDIRPNNVLVTHDHESLLGDFGLAKAGYDESQYSSGNNVVGTLGYMAPEYAANGRFSAKTDVYAFGVVLLQLITGLKTTDKYPEDKSLVEWAVPLLEQRNYPRLIDKRIMDSHDFHQLFWMVELAGKCLKKDPNKRHTMEWVVKTLSNIMEGNADTCIDFNTKGNNEDDQTLGTVTTSSCSDTTCSSKRWSTSLSSSNSTHEEYERRKIPLKHKGPSPNKSKLLYEEMIH
ncbi:putative Fanconi anemia group D2 protein -like protein [Capsicum annuum]|nr:putative Fanconi anemia group D2 protein -like protein [Capsicum annuum]